MKISNGVNIIEPHRQKFDAVVDFFKKDIQGLRTNRASADLVKHILIETYGTKTPLEQIASINVPEPRTIVIQPWDKNIIKDVERALVQANLGVMPTVKELVIHLVLPPLTEEVRKNLVKVLQTKLENAKKSLRSARDEVREEIIDTERSKTISEDEKYRLLEDLDKLSRAKQEEMELIRERKEKEITTI